MKSKEFRKKFANQKAQDRFFDHPDREGNFEIHYVQKADISEAKGTPGGIEMHRTPQMVNLAMQQNLYKKDLEAYKKQKRKETRKQYPAPPKLHLGAYSYPISAIEKWIDTKDVGEALTFAVNKFAHKQSNDFKSELIADPAFKKAVINFFKVAAATLEARNAAMAKSGGRLDTDYRTKKQTEAGFEVINRINDILLTYMKKYGVDKTGRRVPPGFNYNLGEGDVVQFPKKHPYEQLTNCKKCGGTLQDGKDKEGKLKICVPCMTIYRAPNQSNVDEGVITQHDAKDPEVAIIGGAGTMSLSRLKKKAQGEAEQLANDLTRGLFKAAAYNIKQLENTLKTIAAAEDEMEKGYFGEDFTGQFAAERTAETNPYGGMRDHQNRGMIGETPTDNPTGASGEGGWRKYRPKVSEDLSQADVDSIERFADKLYKKLGIDITFTKHFMDRVNDERNGKPISGAELVRLFKKEYERWGKDVAQMGPDMEGTFKDLTTDINLPFVLRWDRDEEELDLIAKTVMRKKDFKTHNQEFPVDESEEQLDEKCWTGYKKVGMKNKGGRQVPNCVKKESAIMRGLQS
jgi:hypothetical protein